MVNFSKNAVEQFRSILAAPARYMNAIANKFVGMVPKNPQGAIFCLGDKSDITAEPDEAPIWIYADVPALAANDTEDMRIGCPENFTLFAVMAQILGAEYPNGGFRLQLYDVNRKVQLIRDHPVNFEAYCGNGRRGSALFLREPYPLQEKNAQILVRVGNLEAVPYALQVVLFGYQSGGAV
jgi:hypothetical protein